MFELTLYLEMNSFAFLVTFSHRAPFAMFNLYHMVSSQTFLALMNSVLRGGSTHSFNARLALVTRVRSSRFWMWSGWALMRTCLVLLLLRVITSICFAGTMVWVTDVYVGFVVAVDGVGCDVVIVLLLILCTSSMIFSVVSVRVLILFSWCPILSSIWHMWSVISSSCCLNRSSSRGGSSVGGHQLVFSSGNW